MKAATDDRYERGLDAYASQFRIPREEVAGWFAERVGERFGEEAIHSAAHAWEDDELSLRDRSLVVIAALIAQGDTEPQLRAHARWALDHGSTREELEALATLLGIYAGFPRASRGLIVIREELDRLEEARRAEERRAEAPDHAASPRLPGTTDEASLAFSVTENEGKAR